MIEDLEEDAEEILTLIVQRKALAVLIFLTILTFLVLGILWFEYAFVW